jgi:hypothetical protein
MGISAGTAALISAGVGAATSIAGTAMSASAAADQQRAIREQNQATQAAQQQAFTQRNIAGQAQTAGQTIASQQTLADRSAAADTMREAQMSALKNYQDTINAQNQQSEMLRQTGDVNAQQLLQQTNAQQLAAAQEERQRQAAELLNPSLPKGPEPSDPGGNAASRDPVQGGALARRTAQAATNIRNYGSAIGTLSSYDAPVNSINLAVAQNRAGIMPAQTAEQLLKAGSATRLLPTQVAYRGATGTGQAQDVLLQSRGQNALDAASLSYGNAVDIANLTQADAEQIAKNRSAQLQANASAAAQTGQTIKGLGNLGLYGAGYLNSMGNAAPGWVQGTGLGSNVYMNTTTGATTDQPGVSMPGLLSRIF